MLATRQEQKGAEGKGKGEEDGLCCSREAPSDAGQKSRQCQKKNAQITGGKVKGRKLPTSNGTAKKAKSRGHCSLAKRGRMSAKRKKNEQLDTKAAFQGVKGKRASR